MKKFAILFSALAFAAAVAALAVAAANFLERKRDLFGYDYDDFDDDMIDADLDFYAEPIESTPDLSVEAEGNTAPIDNADPPADALPQEH